MVSVGKPRPPLRTSVGIGTGRTPSSVSTFSTFCWALRLMHGDMRRALNCALRSDDPTGHAGAALAVAPAGMTSSASSLAVAETRRCSHARLAVPWRPQQQHTRGEDG